MKKTTFIKSLFLIVALLVGSGTAWAETITIDGSKMTTTDQIQSVTEGGIGFSGFMKQYQTTKIWFTSGTGFIYNTASLGSITKITLSYNGGGSGAAVQRFNVGAAAMTSYMAAGGTTVSASAGGTTYDYTGGVGNGFFNISVSSKNLQLVSLVIEYTPSGAPTAVSTPTISATGLEKAVDDYYNTANITLASTTDGASIYYTTNGDAPTASSTAYTVPFEITSTATIKAIATKAGLDNSEIASKVITITTLSNPTIEVTEVTVPDMEAVTGLTDSETLNVSGIALTADILVSIAGTDAAMFSVLPASIVQTDGVASSVVTVSYNPTAPGTHTATLKFNSTGGTEVTRTLNGTSVMATPVTVDASGITSTGFTANWNAVAAATEYELNVYTKTTGALATDLFISEYGEGSGNNKYIEIFNGTGNPVNLSAYTLKQAYNGGGWDVSTSYTLPLTGTLANNSVYVIANASANATVLAKADLTVAYHATDQGGKLLSFTGNDAMGLFKNDVLIDVFGDPTSNATIPVAGFSTYGQDHTIVRKPSVSSGNIDWTVSSGTNVTDSEWIGYASDTWTYLGAHTMDGGFTTAAITGSPFTVTGATSKTITDLTSSTDYYYTVVAKYGAFTTALSNEVKATTDTGTGLSSTSQSLKMRAVNGNIVFNTEAGRMVEVYNSIGQKISNSITTEGLNSIPARVKGVIFVKIGTEVSKLIVE